MQKPAPHRRPNEPAYPISSVDRALRLLQLFRETDGVRLTEACAYLGVANSTAHRLLAMLIHHGFVTQDPQTRLYKPGSTLIEIGLSAVRNMDVRGQLRPFMEELADRFDETVHLAELEGDQVRFLDAVESEKALRVSARTGHLMPAHCTSVGKALLAELPRDRLSALYRGQRRLTALTDKSVRTFPELVEVLDGVRQDGFATNAEEIESGVGSVAMAMHDKTGYPIASMAIAVPVHRLTPERQTEMVAALRDVARRFHQRATA